MKLVLLPIEDNKKNNTAAAATKADAEEPEETNVVSESAYSII